MKAQELIVSCSYTNEGATMQDLVRSSFVTFLKKEIENLRRSHIAMYDRRDE